MGIFRTRDEPSLRPQRTVTGGAITRSEEIGDGLPRRVRSMALAVRTLEGHPLTTPDAIGVPLGDGQGLEELVARIAPLFAAEESLIRWSALRGALLMLDMVWPDDTEWARLAGIMGVRGGPLADPPGPACVDPRFGLDAEVETNVIGLFSSITGKWSRYAELAEMDVLAVNADPELSRMGAAVGLDYIAWTAAAVLRAGHGRDEFVTAIPEPGRLDSPGWYVEPLFAKCERYWDGTDWTERVRMQRGRAWDYGVLALR